MILHGRIRSVNITKGNFPFAIIQYIDLMLDETFGYIKKEFLELEKQEITKENLAKILTKILADLNVIHPFREGNGRVTREYIRQLAYFNNYLLNFANYTEVEIMDAMKLSVINTNELYEIIKGSLYKK